jgi:hypothetical protein
MLADKEPFITSTLFSIAVHCPLLLGEGFYFRNKGEYKSVCISVKLFDERGE